MLAGQRLGPVQNEVAKRSLQLLVPALLVVFVVATFSSHPRPGLGGERLVATLGVAAFVVGAQGARRTLDHPFLVSAPFILVTVAGAAALMWVQPRGPGAAGALGGVLLLARRLPVRVAVPAAIGAFVCLEVVAAVIGGIGSMALLAAFGGFFGMRFLAVGLDEANRRAEQLIKELEQSRVAEARAAALAERQRLAREMHDVLAHSLSGLMLQLEGARMLAAEAPADPRMPEVINRAHHLARGGLEEARRAIGMLRDDELPGPERLAGLAAQFEKDWTIPCHFDQSGPARTLSSETRLTFYRVAQEALTNITKHARPRRVDVHLYYEPTETRLVIEDVATANGTPPDRVQASVKDTGGGYGLAGMTERAELLGGTLSAGPTESGFRVELAVPT